ncbi:MAG: biotin synthase BioB [Chthoniobacterales bacterium]|nr:biotin synthase BioB [Chthoniobacterales bacterium]
MSFSLAALETIYHTPFFDLIKRSNAVHQEHWKNNDVQLCTLLSVKTGGCSENCSYCAQSAHYKTGVKAEKLMTCDEILPLAEAAKKNGSTRFCMGAAWKGVRTADAKFQEMLKTIRAVSQLGMEVCVTLGHLGEEEAHQLKEAGVTAYNHNLDTSPEYYSKIVTTHTYEDRLNTIAAVQRAGMSVCCGGIIGMGESETDRLRLLEVLCNLDPAPTSVPINCLMAMPGTPLEGQPPIDIFELVKLVAATRIALPKARVRLSAGRTHLSAEGQALCFFAGANSIFYGDKLLTASNPEANNDLALLEKLHLTPTLGPVPMPHHEGSACQ